MKKFFLSMLVGLSCSFSVLGQQPVQQIHENLYQAVNSNDTKTAAKLLRAKADPNATISAGTWMKVSMLTLAVLKNNTQMAKLLLKNKANVNQKDGFNTSPLMYAAAQGNKELVQLLLKHGADAQASDGGKNTVLSAAQEGNNPEVIALIEEKIKSGDKGEKAAKN